MDDRSRREVRETYEDIGAHFSKTREYAWPEVEAFVDDYGDAETALDVGCGNGRHTELLADSASHVVGLDVSRALLAEARSRTGSSVSFLQGDGTALPIVDDRIDVAVYVATIHHLPSRAERRTSLRELARVLSVDGRALVSAWSTAHERFDAAADAMEGFDTTVDWTLPGGETVPRFYHIYAPAELRADVESSGLAVVEFEVSSGNCYAVVEPEGKRP